VSKHWKRATSSVRWNHTATTTTTKGASLTLPGVHLDTVGGVATYCPTCGKVSVFVGKKKVATLNLHATSTQQQRLAIAGSFPETVAPVRIVAASAGKKAQIDGPFSFES
jgi:hypothetical protein